MSQIIVDISSFGELLDLDETAFMAYFADKDRGFVQSSLNLLNKVYNQVTDMKTELVQKTRIMVMSTPEYAENLDVIKGLLSKLMLIEHRCLLLEGEIKRRALG